MGKEPQPSRPCTRPVKHGNRLKSGCRTCKIRKIRCHQQWPECHRCLSTGRLCDEYGVWGGGTNSFAHGKPHIVLQCNNIAPDLRSSIAKNWASKEEQWCFEWFKCRTAKKIRGAFVSSFWDTLVFQAGQSEPAVLHAILALTAVHERDVPNGYQQGRDEHRSDKQEQFVLRHYSKAIRHLKPHLFSRERSSIRITLIACVLFVCLELLRGHFSTAQTHLRSGLQVLIEMNSTSGRSHQLGLRIETSSEVLDDWIAEAFSRLDVQLVLFFQDYEHTALARYNTSLEIHVPVFRSLNQAWLQMEHFLNKVVLLAHHSRKRQSSGSSSTEYCSTSIQRQQQLRVELSQRYNAYKASRATLEIPGPYSKGFRLLDPYHSMAVIMVATCLWPDNESIYDTYTDQFVRLLDESIYLWKYRSSDNELAQMPHSTSLSGSIMDIGWIPPLYYTALKCRVHRVRLHAVRLLESTSHREGIWDSHITALVARKVIQIEEADFDEHVDLDDNFSTFHLSWITGPISAGYTTVLQNT